MIHRIWPRVPCVVAVAYSDGMDAMVAVEVPLVGDARHKNWAKVIDNVDETKSSGWAFDGEFIAAGGIQDVPVGAIVMVYGERGSAPTRRSRRGCSQPTATGRYLTSSRQQGEHGQGHCAIVSPSCCCRRPIDRSEGSTGMPI